MSYSIGTRISLRADRALPEAPRHFLYEVGTKLRFDRRNGRLFLPRKINVAYAG